MQPQATLIITVIGERSDLDYLRSRLEGACVDVVAEEESHLDGTIEIDAEWGDDQ